MTFPTKTLLAITALVAVGPGGATAGASSTSGCGPLTSSPTPPAAELPATLTLRSTTGRVQIVLRHETQRTQMVIRLYMLNGGRRLDATSGSYSCTAARSKDFIAFPITAYAHRLFHHHATLAVNIRIKMTNGSGVTRTLQRRAVIVKGV